VLGTAAYLAPEQARGEDAGPSADLYALGVVAYQLISGRLPYDATSLTELALKQQQEEPPTLDTLVAAVNPELADAVAIALALDPRDRYESAREMRRALSDGARGIPPGEGERAGRSAPVTRATSVLSAGERAAAPARTARTRAVTPRRPRPGPARQRPEPIAAQSPAARPRRRRGRLLGLLAALLALALIVLAIVLIASPSSTTEIRLRNVVYQDVEKASAALQQLVSENTR
jgi:eukaryotic-like serine/threonine-protein kinase